MNTIAVLRCPFMTAVDPASYPCIDVLRCKEDPAGGTRAAACCAPLGAASLSDTEAKATAGLFKALADPHRVRIVNLLATSPDPVCVCELTGPLGLSQPTVSHHLKKLVDAGLLEREQRGTWAYYSLDRAALGRLAAATDLRGAHP
jgi:ArsR family transcriptional regulator, arsenate/arsenite/antimonite-responsive transcriptional repressor